MKLSKKRKAIEKEKKENNSDAMRTRRNRNR